jgi:nitrate/nitrite transporter NarK
MSFCYFIKVVFKNYGNINFNDDEFLTQVAGTSFLCGASARFLWGTIQDYIGFKKVYATILFFLTILAFTINEISHSRVLYQLWIGLIFAMEGGHFSIFPAVACNIYGAQ